MEEALTLLLTADAGVRTLVRSQGVTRVNWVTAPQGVARPNIVLQRISGVRDTPMDGPSGLIETLVQVDCYGLTYASAKGVARAVEAVLSGYSGTSDAEYFGGIFLVNERDGYEDEASPDKLFRVSMDFRIWHNGA